MYLGSIVCEFGQSKRLMYGAYHGSYQISEDMAG